MRVKAITEEGEVVTLPSIDKDVEQFHTIQELTDEKGLLGRSNSVIDFQTLESGNPASDSYWEKPDLYRRYTLPRGFKLRTTARDSTSFTRTNNDTISKTSPVATEESGLKKYTSSNSMAGVKQLYNEPRPQNSLGDLHLRELCSELRQQRSFRDFNLRQLYAESKTQPSFDQFNLDRLFKEQQPLRTGIAHVIKKIIHHPLKTLGVSFKLLSCSGRHRKK